MKLNAFFMKDINYFYIEGIIIIINIFIIIILLLV